MLNARSQETVRALCDAFVAGLRGILAEKLAAVYVYGAVAFPETTHTGDVDFHVILSARPAAPEHAALLGLHSRLAAQFPPLGAELDGYYVLLADAGGARPPQHLLFPHLRDDSWALHRAHILAGRVVVLHGPDPRAIYSPPIWSELEQALDGELDYVERHLAKYPAYCVLNLCRLLYSWETRDVVTSKAAAATWAKRRFPVWACLVDRATAAYAQQTTGVEDKTLACGVHDFHTYAVGEMATLRTRP